MSDTTPNLRLPYIMSAQAQKHVTHNEAIRALDALVQLSVESRTRSAPPSAPADGARYLIPSGASGSWSGKAGSIAAWQDGSWSFLSPLEGWLLWIRDEDLLSAFDGTAWTNAGGSTNPVAHVGVNATADDTNRLTVSSPASLFNHEGAGHQQKINKHAAGDTASTLYQTNYSGRAQAGLAGDDNYHLKVSADGSTWKEAMVVDRSTGVVTFPNSSIGLSSPWAGKAWAALGDSITAGNVSPTYVTALATLLGVTATNLGVGGTRIVGATGQIYDQVASIPGAVDLVTVAGGINDYNNSTSLGTMGDTGLTTFYGGVFKISKDILTAHPNAILVWITPYDVTSSKDDAANSGGVRLRQYVQAIKDVAAVFGCPVIDLHGESGISGYTASLFLGDGLHPNSAGAARYAKVAYDRLLFIEPTGIASQVATPAFSLAAGTYEGTQSVTISCATSGATIYYTTDGSTPTTSSSVYSGALSVSSSRTVKALAVKSGLTNSAVASAAYTIITQVSTPTFSPAAGSYTSIQSVTISCATSGATIYYTTDGSTPTTSSSVYSGAISVAATATVKAIGVKSGLSNSAVGSAAYTISLSQVATPTFSPAAGSYSGTQSVTIACATSGATIYYTTDGSTPTTSSSVYSAAISVASSQTIKALAVKSGMADSAVGSAAYTISSAFTPASLSPAMWFDASDLSTLWQDTGATSAVASDGQAVARIDDKSGNARHGTQATSGNRPLYKTDGTLRWLSFDGDDEIPIASLYTTPTSGEWAVAYAARRSDSGANNGVVTGQSDTSGSYWLGDNLLGHGQPVTRANLSGGTEKAGGFSTSTATNDHTVIVNVTGGTLTFYQDGVAGNSFTGFTDFKSCGLGFGISTFRYAGRIYELVVIPRALTNTEIANLTTWLKAKAGVA
jgi:lysophospholipase L1-like esterase